MPFQLLQDDLLYAPGIGENVVVPEANDPPPPPLKPRRPAPVVVAVGMLSAIRLDDQAVLEAGKIDDEGPEGMLTAELVALEPPPAQSAPQATLGVGHGDPQLACFALSHDRENSTYVARPLTLPALTGRAPPSPAGAGEGLSAVAVMCKSDSPSGGEGGVRGNVLFTYPRNALAPIRQDPDVVGVRDLAPQDRVAEGEDEAIGRTHAADRGHRAAE